MMDVVDCPYCAYENDMTDALADGLDHNGTFDWQCQGCEKEFEVFVEFDPVFSSSEIEIIDCEKCGVETRDICERGRILPYPKHLKEDKVCQGCWREAVWKEIETKQLK